ncbi:39 kDa FK506-binding nuclear protein-like [Macrosteles quadrilineatus]|uniref:39 kDa FK506-binding nuclear protein-like n=1 Tax=Macrosteles quadrilineatus TaxID=74068 RepID=UPI0023E0B720|nr:39 kDa FK506-binding nuclear protein-like [Macrosteles quadrilineatus]
MLCIRNFKRLSVFNDAIYKCVLCPRFETQAFENEVGLPMKRLNRPINDTLKIPTRLYSKKVKTTSHGAAEKHNLKEKTLQGGVTITDVVVGNGSPAKSGSTVTVYYSGKLRDTNKQFDAMTSGRGLTFHIGKGEVIDGWDVGLVGMKVGGKRVITCPPDMAYGAEGYPPKIPSNSTLVFEVELKAVK